MSRRVILAASLTAIALAGCVKPIKAYHGYVADEAHPSTIQVGEDSRSTVLAQLGSPSTEGAFDELTWVYLRETQESLAFFKPKVSDREITAIRFGEDDLVDEVLTYDANDGQVISYAARETPTRGRELGLMEQLFGTVGNMRLPNSTERTPDNPTGRR
ncbi:MAG: outer membrane protein assembly factor BamE [Hyphomonas sp.]